MGDIEWWLAGLTVLARDVATYRGVGHAVLSGEGEDVRGARDAAGGAGAAVTHRELVEVKPELTDSLTESLDKINTGAAAPV